MHDNIMRLIADIERPEGYMFMDPEYGWPVDKGDRKPVVKEMLERLFKAKKIRKVMVGDRLFYTWD